MPDRLTDPRTEMPDAVVVMPPPGMVTPPRRRVVAAIFDRLACDSDSPPAPPRLTAVLEFGAISTVAAMIVPPLVRASASRLMRLPLAVRLPPAATVMPPAADVCRTTPPLAARVSLTVSALLLASRKLPVTLRLPRFDTVLAVPGRLMLPSPIPLTGRIVPARIVPVVASVAPPPAPKASVPAAWPITAEAPVICTVP